jgi:hypothetical protein
MGAETFFTRAKGKTASDAFTAAREQALYEYGHRGYTGTIAEKHEFLTITPPPGLDPEEFASKLLDEDDPRISDKWGPAGCVKLGEEKYLFFGWASS